MYEKTTRVGEVGKVALDFAGVTVQPLIDMAEKGGSYVVTTIEPGATIPAHHHSVADEFVFVLAGDFVEHGVVHGPGTAFFARAGTAHGPHTSQHGCTVLTHFSAPLDFIPAS